MAHFNQQVEGRRKELPLAGSLVPPGCQEGTVAVIMGVAVKQQQRQWKH